VTPTDPDRLEIRGIRTEDELRAVADLYAKAFRGYEHHYRLYLENVLKGVPRSQWRLSRTMWTPDGDPVAHMRICDRTMRLGAAMVRVGGIGDVCTHPFRRKAGLMRRLFEHVLDFLRDESYDLSILWGIPRFYDKFGYIVALTDDTIQMPRRQVARLAGPYRGRRAKRADADALWRLFKAELARRDGAMERSRKQWLADAIGDKWTRVLTDDRGRLRAYYQASPDGDALVLSEVSLGTTPRAETIRSLLADMVKTARRHEKPTLRFGLPPSHPLGQFAVADGCEIRREIGHRGGAMARIGNLQVLRASLIPEWERLLAASPAADWSGRLRLTVSDPTEPHGGGGGTFDLVIRGGTVAVEQPRRRTAVRLVADQDKLTRLILGFHDLDAAALLGEVNAPPAAEHIVKTLFPRRDLLISPADHF
jgi:predicted N-acetyltransferase YhbS